ncbi:hypothetical protein [Subtercola endophyticus]|uniref:hypothetical protein n=1 Tax=Subtercola endophyticus TaxID=2895559 RepID=UPI001E3E6E90|nr:hypothetical protein [Subtercola endophyticus]UFS58458.1 hypothetical protein LQ955_15845 [Subtercola endophyticus]
MMNKKTSEFLRNSLTLRIGVAAAVAIGAIGAVNVVSASASPAVVPSAAPVSPASAGEFTTTVFGSPVAVTDKLPDIIDGDSIGTAGIQQSSVRFLGTKSGSSYWTALGQADEICLVAFVSTDDVASSACASPSTFNAQGVGLRLFGPTQGTEGYLVPDASALKGAALVAVVPNLVTIDPLATAATRASTTVSGSKFQLTLLPPAAASELPAKFKAAD